MYCFKGCRDRNQFSNDLSFVHQGTYIWAIEQLLRSELHFIAIWQHKYTESMLWRLVHQDTYFWVVERFLLCVLITIQFLVGVKTCLTESLHHHCSQDNCQSIACRSNPIATKIWKNFSASIILSFDEQNYGPNWVLDNTNNQISKLIQECDNDIHTFLNKYMLKD